MGVIALVRKVEKSLGNRCETVNEAFILESRRDKQEVRSGRLWPLLIEMRRCL